MTGAGGRMPGSPLERHAVSAPELKERLDAERAGVAFLAYRDDSGHQRIVPLEPGRPRLTIGRRRDCDIPLGWDAEVSRVHAELELVGGDWTIVDAGLSRNGTFVNGDRLVERRRLSDGDELRFGHVVAAFRVARRSDTLTTKVPDELAPVSLSETQRKVLVALCRPYRGGERFATPATNRQIADELFLSVEAVKGHLRALFGKLAIDGLPQNQKRTRLAELAVERGLVQDAELFGPEGASPQP